MNQDSIRQNPGLRFISIDSGGTNTRGLVGNKQGDTLGRYQGPGANPKDIGWEAAYKIFKECIDELLKGDYSSLGRICLTAAGIGDLDKESPKIWGKYLDIDANKLIIIGDAYAAHLGAFLGDDGIIVVAGTGTALVARKGLKSQRLGGWGHILGDQGSGFAIGLAGIRQAVMDSDLGQKTALLEALQKHYQIKSLQDLVEKIYGSAKAKVAEFAKDVLDLAEQGNKLCQQIIAEQVQTFKLLFRRFQALGYPPKVSYTGGLFEHAYYLKIFSALVEEVGLELQVPKLSPLDATMQVALGNLEPLTP